MVRKVSRGGKVSSRLSRFLPVVKRDNEMSRDLCSETTLVV